MTISRSRFSEAWLPALKPERVIRLMPAAVRLQVQRATVGARALTQLGNRLPVVSLRSSVHESLDFSLEVLAIQRGDSWLTLRLTRPATLHLEAGQHLAITVETDEVTVVRAYSVAGFDEETLELGIRKVEDGIASTWLHEHLRVGDTLSAYGPLGDFASTAAEAERLVLIAGGAGITPLLSVLRTLVLRARSGNAALRHISLIYANRCRASTMYACEVDKLVVDHGLELVEIVEDPESRQDTLIGRFDEHLGAIPTDDPTARYLICGPEPMMAAARTWLTQHGVEPDRIEVEHFGVAPVADDEDGQSARTMVLNRSGRELTVSQGATLLAASRAQRGPLPSSCTVGGCGACRVRLLAGRVSMPEPNTLTIRERSEGFILACIAKPETDVVLDI